MSARLSVPGLPTWEVEAYQVPNCAVDLFPLKAEYLGHEDQEEGGLDEKLAFADIRRAVLVEELGQRGLEANLVAVPRKAEGPLDIAGLVQKN